MQRSIRVPVVVLAALVVGVAAGAAVVWATFPSEDELQRSALDEVGLDPALLDIPLVDGVVDELAADIRRRTVAETRTSVLAGAGVALALVAAGTTAAVAGRRRPAGP